ncbi:CidA/LrgA family protein [Nocardioides speluncae]|uniref:CidA/LrgA family protein n=1 Tax=Nocardioides speluncae TaxID=2670337 RepID=UPI000D686BC1|nr:CidA/LrgA family protein [Nocardioides speluncae]
MINGLLWLLACQLAGEVVVRALDLQLPGPVVGMALLFVLLRWRRPSDESPTIRAADALLRHLQLLFVPAGVGVVTYLTLLREDALPIAAGLLVSWLAGLVTVAGLVVLLRRRRA